MLIMTAQKEREDKRMWVILCDGPILAVQAIILEEFSNRICYTLLF